MGSFQISASYPFYSGAVTTSIFLILKLIRERGYKSYVQIVSPTRNIHKLKHVEINNKIKI